MPANEQTWRDLKWMHLVFGITSILMLVTTIWMLTADHDREWKTEQRNFRDVEVWSAKSRVSALENDKQYNEELAKLEAALAETQQEIPNRNLFDDFQQAVADDAERRRESPPDFRKLEALYSNVKRDEENRPAAREAFLSALREIVQDAKFREDSLSSKKKFKAADFDVARSEYELGVGNGLPQDELDAMLVRVKEIKDGLAELTLEVQAAMTHRKELERIVGEMTAKEAIAQKELDEQKQTLTQLETAVEERGGTAWMREFILPYDAVRQSESPDDPLLEFLQTTYEAAADGAKWDRAALERS